MFPNAMLSISPSILTSVHRYNKYLHGWQGSHVLTFKCSMPFVLLELSLVPWYKYIRSSMCGKSKAISTRLFYKWYSKKKFMLNISYSNMIDQQLEDIYHSNLFDFLNAFGTCIIWLTVLTLNIQYGLLWK